MAPTMAPSTTAPSPVEVLDNLRPIEADPNNATIPSWAVNCTALLEPGVNATTGINTTEAYTLCLQQQLQTSGVSSSDFLMKNASELFASNLSEDATTAQAMGHDVVSGLASSPTRVTVLSDWIELLATRQDLLRICIQSTILIAIFLASVLANSFVFVVFCRKPTLLSNSYRFVLNLAVCNCLMTVLVMPFVLVSTFTQEWILGWGSCEIIGMLAILLFVASILTLMLIAMDRYHAIMKPLHYHLTVISQRPGLCIFGVWLVSLIIALPPLLGWNHFTYQPGKAMCTVTWRSADPADRAYSFSFVLLCFVVPYFVMLWVYVCAFRTAQRTTARARRNSVTPEHAASATDIQGITQKMLNRDRRRSSAASLIHTTTRRRSSSSVTRALLSLHRDDWKAAKTSLIVMSAFTVCWLPFFILITMEAVVGPSLEDYGWAVAAAAGSSSSGNVDDATAAAAGLIIPYWLEGGAICLALAGCALNPLVYVFRSEQIKYEIRKLFCPGSAARRRGAERDKEAASTTTAASSCRQGSLVVSSSAAAMYPTRRDSPASYASNGVGAHSSAANGLLPSVPGGDRLGGLTPCSSSASLANSTISQAARITGAAATMVVTFNEDTKHRDGVCL